MKTQKNKSYFSSGFISIIILILFPLIVTPVTTLVARSSNTYIKNSETKTIPTNTPIPSSKNESDVEINNPNSSKPVTNKPLPTSGIKTGTNAPSPTTSSSNQTSSSTGYYLSKSSVDLSIESGKSAKAFDIISTGTTQFSITGYPTSYGPGINWLETSGGMSKGQTIAINIKVNDGITPGIYTGNAVVDGLNSSRITIPVKITVFKTQTSRYVKVISPNGGETLSTGSSANISWEGTDIDKCSIMYLTNNNTGNTIATNIATTGSGSYSWNVNIGNNPQAKISLTCYKTNVGQVLDDSDGFFTVSP